MLENIKTQLKERIELAKTRNFTTIHITLKPNEAQALLDYLDNIALANDTLEQTDKLTSIQAERIMRDTLMKIGGST